MSVRLFEEAAPTGRFWGPRPPRVTPGTAVGACLKSIDGWIVRSGQRKALRELAGEGRLLSDIGLTREQALSEAGKPFWRR